MSECSIVGCGRRLDCRGLCGTHYKNWRATGRPERPCPGCGADMVLLRASGAYCSDACRPACRIEWCENVTTGKREVCKAHYSAILKRGRDPRYGLQKHKYCIACGATDWPDNGLRRYCSRACAALWLRSGGSVASEVECVSCGALTPVFGLRAERGRKVRSDRTRCFECARERNALSVLELRDRDGGDCSICGAEVDFAKVFPDPGSPSVDHIVPLARGGLNVAENLALACLGCNRAKWHTAPA